MKPQEPIPHNYSMRKLNLIFMWTSVALLVSTGAMVFYDYVRGWKWFQLEFNRLQQARIDSELTASNDAAMKKQLAEFDRELKEGQVEIARNRESYLVAQKSLDPRGAECGIAATRKRGAPVTTCLVGRDLARIEQKTRRPSSDEAMHIR